MRSWISLIAAGLGALFLSGCLLPPPVSQLHRMKQNHAKGALESNSRESVTCSATAAACYQLHLLKGDACYALATRATDATLRRDLDTCAADNLLEGVTQAPTEQSPVGDMHQYRLERLEALRDLIDTRRAGEASGADTLTEAAQDFRRRYASDPAGPFYLATARLAVAQDNFLSNGDTEALCSSLSDVDGLARTGDAAPGNLQSQYQNLTKSIAAMRRTGGCT